MSKYIDTEKIKSEIERQQRRLILLFNTEQVDMRRDCALQNGVYDNILSIIASLQQEQPEVELNEETIINEFRIIRDKCFNEGIEGWQREKLIARHFYELGLKARKK